MDILVSIIIIIFGGLQIILFFKLWGMTNDIREVKEMYQSQINKTNKDLQKGHDYSEKKFKEGDLVLILKNENQFRITDIIEENGIFYYTSKRINEKYPEDEIEHFDLYWKNKK